MRKVVLLGAAAVVAYAMAGHPLAGHPLAAAHGSNEALGQQLATAYGWSSGRQWSCLNALWTRESGWQMVWNTAGSGAYGIPQSLPASKMASAGADYMTNPATQIRWGLGYIHDRYGSPCAAWSFEMSHSPNWY